MKAVAIIPARFQSTRFPGKPLASLKGKIVIQHVYEQAVSAKLVDAVFVATDDRRIFDAVISFGGKAVMTSGSHASGTDRIAEAAETIECDYIVNVQGDEPFIRPGMIDDVIGLLYNDEQVSITTLAKKITDIQELMSPHVVKVVMNNDGFAMYFSRAPIPFDRDEWQIESRVKSQESSDRGKSCFELLTLNSKLLTLNWYKHIGVYGFRKNTLRAFTSLEQSRLERIEKLEQLRALEAGMRIKVKITEHDTFGIDTIEDLRKAEEWQNISL
ncbi:MAG: 3-deoxy-manno-octulosonate cytidylyltransferase [Nitrospiraceae bacterium]|nr:MAG: 3-deoxy-manno-octulosonate cytidylyltransferase [Nitrospiraceae bacterium]